MIDKIKVNGYCFQCGDISWHMKHELRYDAFTEKTKVEHCFVCDGCGHTIPDYDFDSAQRRWKRITEIRKNME